MADQIKISIVGLDKLKRDMATFKTELEKKVSTVIAKGAEKIVTRAKQNTPVDEGILRNSISADLSNPFEVHVTVNAPYAAPVEFGTGKFAAEYVSTLPDNWQAFAAQFRGQKGSGTFYDLVIIIKEWLKRKGIDVFSRDDLASNIDVDTGVSGATRKRRSKGAREAKYDEVAYLIARSILKNGIKPQPFLFPAYKVTAPEIIESLRQLFLRA